MMLFYSAFQIDELHRYNQNLVGTLHATSLLWSTHMKNAVNPSINLRVGGRLESECLWMSDHQRPQ